MSEPWRTDEATRERMAHVGSRDTKPEMRVRRRLHAAGYRFRLHARELPGTPDVVLPRFRTAVFVHGCFWHGHPGCRRARLPERNRERWRRKIHRTRGRDRQAREALKRLGWEIHVLWTCDLEAGLARLLHRLEILEL